MEVAGRIADTIRAHNPQTVNIDEIGVGAGVVDRLRELGLSQVRGVNVATKSSKPEHYANLRAELFDTLRSRFEQGRITIPSDRALIAQLASIEYTFTSSGQLLIQSKETMASHGLPSPDLADALALAFADRPPVKLWS